MRNFSNRSFFPISSNDSESVLISACLLCFVYFSVFSRYACDIARQAQQHLPWTQQHRQNVAAAGRGAWKPEHCIRVLVLIENAVEFLAIVVQECKVADDLYQPLDLSLEDKLCVFTRFSRVRASTSTCEQCCTTPTHGTHIHCVDRLTTFRHASWLGLLENRMVSTCAVFSDTNRWVFGKYCSVLRTIMSSCLSSLISARGAVSSPECDMCAYSAWHAVDPYITTQPLMCSSHRTPLSMQPGMPSARA